MGSLWGKRKRTIARAAKAGCLVVIAAVVAVFSQSANAKQVVTWTEQTGSGSRAWTSIASSADGSKLVATMTGGSAYISDDAGKTWTEQVDSGSRAWIAITSSADGTKLAGVYHWGGYILTSDDRGQTWRSNGISGGSCDWTSITSSADGTKLAATAKNGAVFTSSNSGATWTPQAGSGNRAWTSITSSADGTKLAATVKGGGL